MENLETSNPLTEKIDRFALQYSYGEAEKFRWILRGIRRDGEFYGEVHLDNPLKNSDSKLSKLIGVCSWVQSKPLTTNECAAVFENFEAIHQLPLEQRLGQSNRITAKQGCVYRRDDNSFIHVYDAENSTTPQADCFFLNIIAILHPYLSPFEQECRDLMPGAQDQYLLKMSKISEKPSFFRRLLGWKFLL